MPVRKGKTLSLKIEIFKKIAEIPQQTWNSVFPDVLEGYNFYKTLDESGFAQFKFRYILVYDGNLVVGAAPCFLMDFPLDAGVQGGAKKITGFIRKILPSILNVKALLCGLPMDRGRMGVGGKDIQGVVESICNGMEIIAKQERARIIAFKDFDSGYSGLLGPLLDEGFFRIEDMPTTVMEINFSTFQDYLNRLSPASRYDMRRKFRKTDGRVEIKMRAVDRLNDEELEAVYGLYLQTVNKQDIGFEIAPMKFFRAISDNMPSESKFFLWHIDERLAGFALCLFSQEYFIEIYLGFDYSIAYQYHLYFVKIRDLFNWCIEKGFKSYEMGITNYEPKKRLDFEFVRLHIYARHRNRMLNHFFKVSGRFLAPENFDPTLKKMKKEGKL